MNERAAPDAEGVLIAALEQLVDAIVVIDEEERVLFFNAAAERLWGCDRLDVVGSAVREQLPQLAGALAGVTTRSTPFRQSHGPAAEIAIRRCDGSRADASVLVSTVTVGGRALRVAFARDITAEVRGRDEMRLLSLAADETDRVVVITDAERRIVYVNRAFTDLFGYERSEVAGRHSRDVFSGRHASSKALDQVRDSVDRSKGFHDEIFVRDKAGRGLWIHAAINPVLDEAGNVSYVVGVIANITESKQLQMLQRDVLEAVASDLPIEAVMGLICARVEAVAPDTICSILAVDDEKRLRPLAAPSLPNAVAEAIDGLPIGPDVGSCGAAAYRGEPVLVTDIETDPLWKDFKGLVLPLGLKACWSSPIKLRDGKVAGTFAFYYREARGPSPWHEQVVSACLHLCVLALERHAAKQHIARLASFDTLTGLPNRARLRTTVRERLEQTSGLPMALLFIDIDRFKDVNDTLGHSVGDRLLVEVARRLGNQLDAQDMLGRYGGDEFVIMLNDGDSRRAGLLASRMIEQLLAPVVIENMMLPVSASIGVGVYPADGHDGDTLLKHADTAMHEAKSVGGGTFRFFSPEMNSLAQERLVLGAALREAITRRQLKLYYQPQIDCRSGQLCGAEALARWTHPIFGDVSPARFIALAEECGLIEAIGQWALNEACGQMAAWLKGGIALPSISVNLSAVHFRNCALTGLIAETVERHGLRPEMLTVEITEGVIMDDNPVAIETAKAIHALGVRLSLDDFGTGYSSLSYLARLPIDELKIDRGFMRDLENDKNAQAVVTAVVKIGQSLKLTVVAEGVETRAQQRFLDALGCEVLQGFLISRALAPADFERWHAGYRSQSGPVVLSGAA